ncbi:restriction endonuclease subunit S [Desulfovibrio piger]|uniref:restriction endonuclease subunit S n=1 Tax=Desulfovibrio piger TaxID=901 RepID=UPI0026ED26A2|nr:restriction endonuclease subunit S [Desulfovibrio piger]
MARPKKNAAQAQDTLLTLDSVPEIPVEEQPYSLPEGWKWVRLGQVYQINPKVIADDEKLASFIPMERIAPNMKGAFSFEILPWGKIKKGHTQFADGDVAFAKISPCFENGKSMLISGLKNGIGAGTTELIILRQKYILQKYTFYLISNPDFIQKGICTYNGTVGQQRINMDFVRRYPIPLPPLEVQQRIVERIETLFAKLDEAREKAESALESFELRKAAILHKAFTGELTAKWRKEKGIQLNWEEKQLADIGSIVTGSTPSTKHHEYYGDAIPFIKPADLNSGRFVNQASEYLSKEGGKISRSVRAGSTCVCCIGTIGKCGFLTCDATTNQQINTICPYNFMDDLFVYYYCTSIKFKEMLINSSYSTTISIINKSKMSILPIPVPHLSEQQEIVRILDRIFAREQQAREAAENVLQRIDQMKKAILARAFRGELG